MHLFMKKGLPFISLQEHPTYIILANSPFTSIKKFMHSMGECVSTGNATNMRAMSKSDFVPMIFVLSWLLFAVGEELSVSVFPGVRGWRDFQVS